MKTRVFLFLLLGLLLAACDGAADTAVSPQIDLAQLADTIDVQTTNAIRQNPDVVLIDVREQWEFDEGHIPGVTLIPLGEVPNRLHEIPTDKTVVVTCRSGNRSGQAVEFLRANGFDNVHNMAGGILAWEQAGFSVE
ncbi:MAG: rhodanese-like domain-containing protein [Anaerolineae bacterium]